MKKKTLNKKIIKYIWKIIRKLFNNNKKRLYSKPFKQREQCATNLIDESSNYTTVTDIKRNK